MVYPKCRHTFSIALLADKVCRRDTIAFKGTEGETGLLFCKKTGTGQRHAANAIKLSFS